MTTRDTWLGYCVVDVCRDAALPGDVTCARHARAANFHALDAENALRVDERRRGLAGDSLTRGYARRRDFDAALLRMGVSAESVKRKPFVP